MKRHPHRNRRTNIHIWLLCLIGFIIFLACSCSPKFGCPKTRGMIGVSLREAIDKYHGTWVKCKETGLVCVFNPEGKLIGYYHER